MISDIFLTLGSDVEAFLVKTVCLFLIIWCWVINRPYASWVLLLVT